VKQLLFSKYLLLSEKLDDHVGILKGLKQNVLPKNSFIVCINNTSKNLMDIYYSVEIHKPYVDINNLLIIAICKDKSDAKDKCAQILGTFIAENKSLDGFKAKFCSRTT